MLLQRPFADLLSGGSSALRDSETRLTIVYAAVLSRIAAEAAQRPRMRPGYEVDYADLSRTQLCLSWPSGLLCGQTDP